MTSFFLLFSFILGTLIGSFLNVVAFRYNTGLTLRGRSKCFSCDKTLTWIELFPIVSFLLQGGSCRKCKSRISWQYPLVEICSGALFILVFYFFPPVSAEAAVSTIFYLLITCLLIVITIYDAKHKIIPDSLSYSFAIVALAYLFIAPDLSFAVPPVWALLAGPIAALPFFLLWLISKGTWMGLGDSKLMLGIGWTLGLVPAISAVTLAFWIAAVISVVWMGIVFKKFKKNYEIPFGPYLVLGMYLVLFFDIRVFDAEAFMSIFL
ncbi:MAG: prepilin peptidase [bacterium]|nr:prepilin peptidase [bacterium]